MKERMAIEHLLKGTGNTFTLKRQLHRRLDSSVPLSDSDLPSPRAVR